jgi:hypothetical protein
VVHDLRFMAPAIPEVLRTWDRDYDFTQMICQRELIERRICSVTSEAG